MEKPRPGDPRARPVVVDAAEREWEGWPSEQRTTRGEIVWKTLISGETAGSESLTLGLARLRPGEMLRDHRHPQAEVYLVLEGAITLTVEGDGRRVAAGSAAYVAPGALHGIANAGDGEARFAYAFAADRADEVAYEFPDE